jgi:hypothetical protein
MPVVRYVTLAEYKGKGPMWVQKPLTMIEKVAVVQTARALAPEELAGLYAAEEFGGASKEDGTVDMNTQTLSQQDALIELDKCTSVEDIEKAKPAWRDASRGWKPGQKQTFAEAIAEKEAALVGQEHNGSAVGSDRHEPSVEEGTGSGENVLSNGKQGE